jgi:hypothetical protein
MGFDLVSGYKHKDVPPSHNMTLEELKKGGYILDEHAWLNVSISTNNALVKHKKKIRVISVFCSLKLSQVCREW